MVKGHIAKGAHKLPPASRNAAVRLMNTISTYCNQMEVFSKAVASNQHNFAKVKGN